MLRATRSTFYFPFPTGKYKYNSIFIASLPPVAIDTGRRSRPFGSWPFALFSARKLTFGWRTSVRYWPCGCSSQLFSYICWVCFFFLCVDTGEGASLLYEQRWYLLHDVVRSHLNIERNYPFQCNVCSTSTELCCSWFVSMFCLYLFFLTVRSYSSLFLFDAFCQSLRFVCLFSSALFYKFEVNCRVFCVITINYDICAVST